MSQVDRDQIERSLPTKGFVREETHHRYFYHEFNGKRTGAYTYTSHGSSYKTYGDPLLKRMKKELRLDTLQEVRRLLECPMDGDQYNKTLKAKGLIPD
ncbi:MAG TPA: hypothetical protein VJ044_11375 [Candidatus Hodarchaeales archaeon]|jgi:hypothetical protein|nr:hypothetical protein [Candidatus Hodarchaeales archaeon]